MMSENGSGVTASTALSCPQTEADGLTGCREAARLDALHQLNILDTPPSEGFDRITRMASQIFGLPIAAMSLTDSDRQWFKSRVGVDHMSIPRLKAPCSEVAETTEVVVIHDFLADAEYSGSVLALAGIRFYAGAPLVTTDGHGLGALCVLGTEPRGITPQELAALKDLAAMVMSQIELQHAFGRIDPLSGLPNRTQFMDDLDDLARGDAGQRRLAVLIDLARHEQINSLMRVMGASYVDDVVKEASRTIRAALGTGQALYHVAATQFAFLSPPEADAQDYIALLSAAFATIRATSTVRFVTTVAAGVMPFRLGATHPRDVLRAAQSAAEDSRRGDGAISLYLQSNDGSHHRQFALINAFGTAVEERDQLRMVFQPRIALDSRRCVGAEALLRWRHPSLGDVSPGEFVPLIEHTSLAKAMTARVLDLALAQLREWHRAGLSLPLSVNVSAANLDEHDFVDSVRLCLLKHHIPPELLELEVTESAVMENSGKALDRLKALAATGVRLAIDDFGTGYSSIAYLQKLPAHVVKIDRSFVVGLSDGAPRVHALVGAMMALSHQLGFRIVAEGVETAEAAKALTLLGCEEAQGCFFAPPLEAADFAPWVADYNAGLQITAEAA
jgi:EAL domain-containing protein (putative c-di-GMP-specific phosphodiesterase class I)/GAF domain-containing protein